MSDFHLPPSHADDAGTCDDVSPHASSLDVPKPDVALQLVVDMLVSLYFARFQFALVRNWCLHCFATLVGHARRFRTGEPRKDIPCHFDAGSKGGLLVSRRQLAQAGKHRPNLSHAL